MHPYKRRDVLKKSGTAAATVKADVSKKRAPRRQHGNVKSVALVSTAGLLVTSVMDLKSSEREMNVNRVPSCQIDPLPRRAQELYTFMIARERIRVRRIQGHPWPWSLDDVLNNRRFTNVKREHDRTSKWMRQHFTDPHAPAATAGDVIFNCAFFRTFGTIAMGSRVGWITRYDADQIIEAAKTCRESADDGYHAFTAAYCLPHYNSETSSTESAERAYIKVCKKYLQGLWDVRDTLGDEAIRTRSWEVLVQLLRKVSGFGGSGFMAKEICQDLMQTHVLKNCIDANTWCPTGPGARRGLNRLHRRPTSLAVSNNTQATEARFLDEMHALYKDMCIHHSQWCRDIGGLELHDIQFQLCEFDKYERVRNGEGGKVRKYNPPIL